MMSQLPRPRIPPELVLAILNAIPERYGLRVSTLCNARLVSRSWSKLLLSPLFTETEITLTKNEGKSLEALCAFFAGHPDVCQSVHSLTLYDKNTRISKPRPQEEGNASPEEADEDDEDEGSGDDEDEQDDGDGVTERRCATEPELLARTLSYLSHLSKLCLRNVLLKCPLDRWAISTAHHGYKPLSIGALRITLPGWDDDISQATQLVYNLLSMFDRVDELIITATYDDLQYIGLAKPDLSDRKAYPESPLRISKLKFFRAKTPVMNAIANEAVFSAVNTIEIRDCKPGGPNALLSALQQSLKNVTCNIPTVSYFPKLDAPPPIDLSVCRNVTSLTLSFHLLTNYGERHSRAVAYVNQTLSSLEQRPSDSTPLENLVLQIQTNYQEPKYHKLESWPLDVKSMRQMEDILLRMCATVHVETNLQRWYSASGAIVYISEKGKDEHDARHMKYAEVCEKALRGVWARLDGKGLLTVATAPVRLNNSPDFSC